MSFFVTSSNPKGGNLGGLAGATKCASRSRKPPAPAGRPARVSEHEHCRREDRIGNALEQIQGRAHRAELADLHTATRTMISATTSLDREGHQARTIWRSTRRVRPHQSRKPLQHDIMTGTNEDGTKNADTCKDWTVGDASAKTMLGHADRLGRNPGVNSWNAIPRVTGMRDGTAPADRRRRFAVLLRTN
jgi:hypothetical protein